MRLICYTLLSLLTCELSAQKLHLELNERVEDVQYNKLIMVVPVFAIKNDSVANPLDISSAKVGDEVNWYSVKLPAMDAKFKKGYAWLYNGASNSKIAKAHTLVVIENPGWTFYPSRVWVDRNHNMDLTDDGPGDSLTLENPIILSLGHSQGYQVFLEHFPSEKFRSFETMNDQAIRKLQGNREFLGTSASFREKRLNVISSKWTNGTDSMRIGIKDVNCNGIYHDDEDMAIIGSYQGKLENLQGVRLVKGKAYLEWRNAAYSIEFIDPKGAFIDLIRDTTSALKYSLNKGLKIPRFKYCTATKKSRHKSIRRLKGKYIYVYIWRDGMEEFYQDSASWHQLGRSVNKDFAVLGLNYGGSAKYVYQYNRIFETQITQGYCSNDIYERLKIKHLPTGILIDKQQRILSTVLTPDQVPAFLSDLNKGQ